MTVYNGNLLTTDEKTSTKLKKTNGPWNEINAEFWWVGLKKDQWTLMAKNPQGMQSMAAFTAQELMRVIPEFTSVTKIGNSWRVAPVAIDNGNIKEKPGRIMGDHLPNLLAEYIMENC